VTAAADRFHTGWTSCKPPCDDPWCNIHGMHVRDCTCPGPEYFHLRGVDPFVDDWRVVRGALFIDDVSPLEGRRTH